LGPLFSREGVSKAGQNTPFESKSMSIQYINIANRLTMRNMPLERQSFMTTLENQKEIIFLPFPLYRLKNENYSSAINLKRTASKIQALSKPFTGIPNSQHCAVNHLKTDVLPNVYKNKNHEAKKGNCTGVKNQFYRPPAQPTDRPK